MTLFQDCQNYVTVSKSMTVRDGTSLSYIAILNIFFSKPMTRPYKYFPEIVFRRSSTLIANAMLLSQNIWLSGDWVCFPNLAILKKIYIFSKTNVLVPGEPFQCLHTLVLKKYINLILFWIYFQMKLWDFIDVFHLDLTTVYHSFKFRQWST